MCGGVKEVLSYLAGIFRAGNMGGDNRDEIGRHPLVIRLMKSICQAKSPTPKYSRTWDPAIALSHFDVTARHTLSLFQLSHKLVTLLALTTLMRCGEIAFQTETIEFADPKVSFCLGTLRKSQRSGPLMRFSLYEWSQNKAI